MSLIEYRNLLYEVSKGIAWITERERLLFICKIFIRDGCENDIQDVLSLFKKLEEKDELGIDSLVVLKELLKRMRKWDLLRIVGKFENKRKQYKRLLEQCGRVLDECNQLERLILVCRGKISRDRQEYITDVWTLFTELEKQNYLGIERLEILKTMAVEMKKPDLLKQVEGLEKKTKQEEDLERKQNELEEKMRRSQAQTAAVLASASYAGGRLIGIVTPHCTFRNVAGGIVVVTTWMILRRSSSLQEFVNTFTEAVLPLGNTLRAISEGSLCFTVQAQTTLALETLWKTYQDGTLQQKLQEFLITEEVKKLVGSEVKLTVEIDEQEYNNAGRDLITTKLEGSVLTERSLRAMTRKKKAGIFGEIHPRRAFSPPAPFRRSTGMTDISEQLDGPRKCLTMTGRTGLLLQVPQRNAPFRRSTGMTDISEQLDGPHYNRSSSLEKAPFRRSTGMTDISEQLDGPPKSAPPSLGLRRPLLPLRRPPKSSSSSSSSISIQKSKQ